MLTVTARNWTRKVEAKMSKKYQFQARSSCPKYSCCCWPKPGGFLLNNVGDSKISSIPPSCETWRNDHILFDKFPIWIESNGCSIFTPSKKQYLISRCFHFNNSILDGVIMTNVPTKHLKSKTNKFKNRQCYSWNMKHNKWWLPEEDLRAVIVRLARASRRGRSCWWERRGWRPTGTRARHCSSS